MSKLINAHVRYKIRELLIAYVPSAILKKIDRKFGICFPKYFEERNVIFIHVPKAAGTNVAQALYGRSITHHSASFFKKADEERFESIKSIAIVRNPLERLVSAYEFAKAGGTSRVPIRNPEIYNIKEFDSFKVFFYEWLVLQDKNTLDYVFKPQVDFLCEDGRIIVDEVFDMSDMRKFSDFIKDNFDCYIDDEKVNSTSSKELGWYYGGDEFFIKDVIEYYRFDYEVFGELMQWAK